MNEKTTKQLQIAYCMMLKSAQGMEPARPALREIHQEFMNLQEVWLDAKIKALEYEIKLMGGNYDL